MGLYDSIAGAADHAAGSIDESIGRQFDDTEGGGFADTTPEPGTGDDSAPETAYETFIATNPLLAPFTLATGGPFEQTESFDNILVDPLFQRPGELPFVDEEDSVDLPLGSLRNPLGDPDFEGSRAAGGRILWVLGGIVLLVIAVNAFASGLAEGLTS
jgi:hypothetical protein